MTVDRPRRAARPLLIAALLAVSGLAFLEWLPHAHAGASQERSCALCQVARADGAAAPPAPETPRPALLSARPAEDPAPTSPPTAPLVGGAAPRAPPSGDLS